MSSCPIDCFGTFLISGLLTNFQYHKQNTRLYFAALGKAHMPTPNYEVFKKKSRSVI